MGEENEIKECDKEIGLQNRMKKWNKIQDFNEEID